MTDANAGVSTRSRSATDADCCFKENTSISFKSGTIAFAPINPAAPDSAWLSRRLAAQSPDCIAAARRVKTGFAISRKSIINSRARVRSPAAVLRRTSKSRTCSAALDAVTPSDMTRPGARHSGGSDMHAFHTQNHRQVGALGLAGRGSAPAHVWRAERTFWAQQARR